MADPIVQPSTSPGERGLFAQRAPEPARASALPWLIAGVVVLLVLAIVFLTTRHKVSATGPQPAAAYASSLAVSDVQMSESSALSGVKVTYIDGMIRNQGTRTVTAATAQVQFANDEQLSPQLETVPVTLIRTHEPYIDTQPISAAPIAPGEQREFRLIFENINSNWNQQLPVIRLTQVDTK